MGMDNRPASAVCQMSQQEMDLVRCMGRLQDCYELARDVNMGPEAAVVEWYCKSDASLTRCVMTALINGPDFPRDRYTVNARNWAARQPYHLSQRDREIVDSLSCIPGEHLKHLVNAYLWLFSKR